MVRRASNSPSRPRLSPPRSVFKHRVAAKIADSKMSLALFTTDTSGRLQAGYVKLQRDQYLEEFLRVTLSKSLQ